MAPRSPDLDLAPKPALHVTSVEKPSRSIICMELPDLPAKSLSSATSNQPLLRTGRFYAEGKEDQQIWNQTNLRSNASSNTVTLSSSVSESWTTHKQIARSSYRAVLGISEIPYIKWRESMHPILPGTIPNSTCDSRIINNTLYAQKDPL